MQNCLKKNDKGEIWDNVYSMNKTIWSDIPSKTVVRFLHALKPPILDFGCGYGRNSIYIAQQGLKVVGIDLSKVAVSLARNKSELLGLKNAHFVQGDEKMISGKFGAVLCIGVIHGTTKDKRDFIINSFHRSIIMKGFFILSCFADTDPTYSKKNEPSFHGIPVELISEKEIKKLFSRFKIITLTKKRANDFHDKPHEHHQWVCLAQKVFS